MPVHFRYALVIAAAVTLINLAKVPVVDDSAYLFMARHVAAHPLDPYAFEQFWYDRPEPAMGVLAPPVLPYWLALGMRLFGENVLLLKLWLFPFLAALCVGTASLLRRFARGTEVVGTLMVGLSPFVAACVNFMLDVPALALGVAGVALFQHGLDRGKLWACLLAGVLACLAAQTKYTMLPLPAVLLWQAFVFRRVGAGVRAVAVGVALFALWELFVLGRHGESHFWYHVSRAGGGGDIADKLKEKWALAPPLWAYLGGLTATWGLVFGRSWGRGRGMPTAALAAAAAAYAGVLAYVIVTGDPHNLAGQLWRCLGVALIVVAFGVTPNRVGWANAKLQPWLTPGTRFLLGWLAVEFAAYFALTPFPGGRRVIGVSFVLALVACRAASRSGRRWHRAPIPAWVAAAVVASGLTFAALDSWDAWPEYALARDARGVIDANGGGRVFTQGHWGWQYNADVLGMRQIVPGETRLGAGDWLVLPEYPPVEGGFFRPYHGGALFAREPQLMRLEATLTADDGLRYQTVPALYGGAEPVSGRHHPRLTVGVYRVLGAWVPQPPVPGAAQ